MIALAEGSNDPIQEIRCFEQDLSHFVVGLFGRSSHRRIVQQDNAAAANQKRNAGRDRVGERALRCRTTTQLLPSRRREAAGSVALASELPTAEPGKLRTSHVDEASGTRPG